MEIRNVEDVAILTPKGLLLGGRETDELEASIRELDGLGNEKLLIDLSQTTFMSSMGMACLFLAHAKYIKRGARVKLCSVDRKIKALFALVKLTLIYGDDLHETQDEALASFRRILSRAEAAGRMS
ncbi:MAG TPA: STAS domain-containing protein [Tepidiformaceae bacterium]|jgi:anti-anti-sigma factor|nr:STAS domain-containing protein [Candidatus Eisenbacteria bacterium]HEX6031507.1 STAS domain-containing protein [Tepidiformaceae bacterium]